MTPDPDDIDARFAELIRDEFGDEPLPQGHLDDSGISGDPAVPPRVWQEVELPPHAWKEPVPPPAATPPETFSLDRAIEAAHPDEVTGHLPEPLPPARPWTGLRLAGAILLGLGLLVLVASVFGFVFESLITSLAGISAVAGLVMLLLRVPKERHGSGPWDNGAQV